MPHSSLWFLGVPMLLVGAPSCAGSKGDPVGSSGESRLQSSGVSFVGLAGKCLDDNGAQTANGTRIQLYTCNATDAQTWSWNHGTLVGPGGKCLDVMGASLADGTKVALWDCNGGVNQQWTATNGQLVGLSGKCLDVTAANSADGTPVELWDCNGGANQQWSARSTGTPLMDAGPSPRPVSATDPSGACPGGSASDGGSGAGTTDAATPPSGSGTTAAGSGGSGGSTTPSPYIPPGYTLTMNDEFDDPIETFPNAKFYTTYHYFGDLRTLAGNDELEVYVDPAYTGSCSTARGVNPFFVSNGVLSLTAAPITPAAAACYGNDFKYTSGLLDSVQTQQYGYWELRAKMPAGQGLWPAFWMDAFDNGGLEMDIFEMLEDTTNRIFQTNHGSGNDQQTVYTAIDTTDGFHTYGFEWTADTITWVVDGVVTRTSPSYFAEPTDFMINLATGGSWGGDPDGTTAFPAQMQLDYIRVYQKP